MLKVEINMKKNLSIIIPVYNLEKYIERCLNSIIQSAKGFEELFEVIIIDDGSKDNTSKIINNVIKDKHYFRYYLIENQGVSNARNVGLKYAIGEYVTFIDGDDYVSKDYLAKIMLNLKDDPEIICFDAFRVKNKESRIMLNLKNETYNLEPNESINKFVSLEFYDKYFTSVWNKVFRLDIINNSEILFNVKKAIGEDEFFCVEYFQNIHSVKSISDPLYYYILRNGSALQKYNKNKCKEVIDYIEIYNQTAQKYSCVLDISNLLAYYIHMWFGLINNELKNPSYKSGINHLKVYLNYTFFTKNIDKVNFKDLNIKLKLYFILIKMNFTIFIYTILRIKNKIFK